MTDSLMSDEIRARWFPGFDFEKTYYLSGPMSGYTDYNYPYFEEVTQLFRSAGVKVESPHENPWPKDHTTMKPDELWLTMMKMTVDQMNQCQGIILLRGWPQSKGVRVELAFAMQEGWPIYYYDDFLLTSMNKE